MKGIGRYLTGYAHQEYAKSFEEFGMPMKFPRCGGWILRRPIPGFEEHDGMGCYPLFTCQDWSQLYADLEYIEENLVTVCAVIDPFGEYDEDYLRRCFQDLVIPFKEHFIVNLSRSMTSFVAEHHRRYARKALELLRVERCKNPLDFIDDWVALYAVLIRRHNIRGLLSFSRSAFYNQLNVPGIVAFRATYESNTVGMLLWYEQGEVAYYHLGAFSDLGYEFRASFALFWTAIEYFRDNGVRWLDLGGGAGLKNANGEGLNRFKLGWSNETRLAYFCGRIFDRARYSEIVKMKQTSTTNYFPAYRTGEFI